MLCPMAHPDRATSVDSHPQAHDVHDRDPSPCHAQDHALGQDLLLEVGDQTVEDPPVQAQFLQVDAQPLAQAQLLVLEQHEE